MARPSKYQPEFRREAVELVHTSDRPIAEMARSLGITDSTLQNWLKAEGAAAARDADLGEVSETEREEVARLRKENI